MNVCDWVGFRNYENLFKDSEFINALVNTILLLASIPIGITLGLLLAIYLKKLAHGSVILSLIYYLPAVTSAVAINVVWRYIFNGEYGITDACLGMPSVVCRKGVINMIELSLDEEEKNKLIESANTLKKVYASINDVIADLNDDVIAKLNDQLEQINSLIDQLKQINDLGQSVTDIENAIYDYLYKGQDIALKFINNANKLLQPVMLVKTSDSFLIPSTSVSAPTKFNAAGAAAGISLYPTSYTAEILAPAYMKLVGVTNVYKNGKSAQGGDADCEAVLKAVNSASEGFASAKYGFELKDAKLMGAKAGYTYEVVYTAVDYSGKVVVKKYYIELV